MSLPVILILAEDPLIAALLGALIQTEQAKRAEIVFAEQGEQIDAALQRLHPRVALIDAGVRSASGVVDDGYATSVIFFGWKADCRERKARGEECFELPAERGRLCERIASLLGEAI